MAKIVSSALSDIKRIHPLGSVARAFQVGGAADAKFPHCDHTAVSEEHEEVEWLSTGLEK